MLLPSEIAWKAALTEYLLHLLVEKILVCSQAFISSQTLLILSIQFGTEITETVALFHQRRLNLCKTCPSLRNGGNYWQRDLEVGGDNLLL